MTSTGIHRSPWLRRAVRCSAAVCGGLALMAAGLSAHAQRFPNPLISPKAGESRPGADARAAGPAANAAPSPGNTVNAGSVVPASARPIMPPGAPPMPGSASVLGPGAADKAEPEPGVPRALQERLQGLQVTVILDGAAVLRTGVAVSAATGTSSGGGSSGAAAPGGAGMPSSWGLGAVTSSAPAIRPGVVTVRHGKPFSLTGEHQLLPLVGARSVALYWMDGPRAGLAARSDGPEGGRLVFYGEIDSAYIAPHTPQRLEQPDAGFVQQSNPNASSSNSGSGGGASGTVNPTGSGSLPVTNR